MYENIRITVKYLAGYLQYNGGMKIKLSDIDGFSDFYSGYCVLESK